MTGLVGGLSQAAASRQQSEPQADEIDGLKCCRAQAANGRLKPNSRRVDDAECELCHMDAESPDHLILLCPTAV